MKKMQEYAALCIPYGQVAWYIEMVVSMVLGRQIDCRVCRDDYDYWCASAVNTKFANAEIAKLIEFVKGNSEMCRKAIPTDSSFSKALDMGLCQALLKYALNLEWTAEYPDSESLWLMGKWEKAPTLPAPDTGTIFLNGNTVNTAGLPSKEDVAIRLFSAGGTFSYLVEAYDKYLQRLGVELYWHYPISNGYYNGTYLMLVQEGVLAISYNEMDECNHEFFSEDSVKLLSAEEIGWYLQNWEQYAAKLQSDLNVLHCFQLRQEDNV